MTSLIITAIWAIVCKIHSKLNPKNPNEKKLVLPSVCAHHERTMDRMRKG